jgi:hypothetical protein
MNSDYYHLLDANTWKEVEVKNIQSNGYVYAGRKYKEVYDVKIFVKKKEQFALVGGIHPRS